MESKTMSTPREKSPLPEAHRRFRLAMLHQAWTAIPTHYRLSYSGPSHWYTSGIVGSSRHSPYHQVTEVVYRDCVTQYYQTLPSITHTGTILSFLLSTQALMVLVYQCLSKDVCAHSHCLSQNFCHNLFQWLMDTVTTFHLSKILNTVLLWDKECANVLKCKIIFCQAQSPQHVVIKMLK